MDKDELIVKKDKNIILKGQRNFKDGLWDIPIPKTNITTKCCLKPTIHPGLYFNNEHKPTTINLPKPIKSSSNQIPQHLQHLSVLAQDNDFNNINKNGQDFLDI